MLTSTKQDILNKDASISSSHKITLEWNYNNFLRKTSYGCYKTDYNTAYQSDNSSSYYDNGLSKQLFETDGLDTTMTQLTAGSSTITVVSATGIVNGMKVSGESIPADTYVTNVSGTTITISNSTAEVIVYGTPVYFYNYRIEDDYYREKYTPILSIFEPNRPDPGIINLVSYRKGSEIIDSEKLKTGNFGSANSGVLEDRVYPISTTAPYRYWNSLRNVVSSNLLSLVGVSASNSSISYAAPFVVYNDSFWSNKIVVKTQKYSGYPVSFKVEYLPHGSNTWTTAMQFTDSATMSDGKLEIFYNGSSWSTTKYEATQLLGTPTDSIKMRGIRFSVTKMSAARVPLEVIEISPRLLADISSYTTSFDTQKSLMKTSYGIPVAGTVAGTATINVSLVDRIFSRNNSSSIISPYLLQGIESKMYQVVDGESIPVGTYYITSWAESSDFSATISLEDYFYFLKRIKSPDIVVANINGVESSVALLMLLDNAGITNYEFVSQSSDAKDDFVMDFFYSRSDETLATTLENIAMSAQYAIYIDANNIIKVITKEKMTELVASADTDFWLVGTEDWAGKAEETYLDDTYVSNIVSIAEEKVTPLTNAVIQYAGVGIKRRAKAIITTPDFMDPANIPYYNASIVNRNLSYVNSMLWSIESTEDSSDKALLSMPYIVDIGDTRPTIITTAEIGNSNLFAKSQSDLIRDIYANATAEEKKYFEIVLDQEQGIQFFAANKYNGHIVIDGELIKYNGMVVRVFDEKIPSNSGTAIVFSKDEGMNLINSASSGVSVLPYSILVELKYKPKNIEAELLSNEIEYEFVSDGRAQKNTKISTHVTPEASEFLDNKFATRLYNSTINSTILPNVKNTVKSVNLLNPLNKGGEYTKTNPGYLKVSGAKSVKNNTKKTTTTSTEFPIDNQGEEFILGCYKTSASTIQHISTRMRLLSKPERIYFNNDATPDEDKEWENRGIAGLAFRLDVQADGTTGYFLEIEDIANLTTKQLANKKFENLRLYRVRKIAGVYTPEKLANAFVNTSAVASESLDMSDFLSNEGKSYTGTSNISISIDDQSDRTIYTVYWESQQVIRHVEPKSERINKGKQTYGFMVRSNSEAMFDYILASSKSVNSGYSIPMIFGKSSEFFTPEEASLRGYFPQLLTSALVKGQDITLEFEDFGKTLREAKNFKVKFENPAVSARIVSTSKFNKSYYVSDFKYSSGYADFWVFNTSSSSITLAEESLTPVMVSGIALEEINPGEITLSNLIYKDDNTGILMENMNKYGENSVSLSGTYLNNIDQASNLLSWIYEKSNSEKTEYSLEVFANPLLEIGDKVRIYYSDIEHEISKIGDKVYYITSISYSLDSSGPKMNISVREI